MIQRGALADQLAKYEGWTYSLNDPRYPTALPGVRLPMAPPNQTNCSAFVEGLVVGAAKVPWSLDAHRRAMIYDLAMRFGPVEALVDASLADQGDPRGVPEAWSVCQGWRGPRGHTFIIAAVHEEAVAILEANRGWGLNGVGYRGHGAVLPEFWWREPRRWTWARVKDTYPELAVGALRLEPRALADLRDLPEPFIPGKPEGGGSIRG